MSEIPYSGNWRDFVLESSRRRGVAWKDIYGFDIDFDIVRKVSRKSVPSKIKVLKSAVFEDHLEELWFTDGKFYRHSGGRGVYCTQELAIMNVKRSTTSSINDITDILVKEMEKKYT